MMFAQAINQQDNFGACLYDFWSLWWGGYLRHAGGLVRGPLEILLWVSIASLGGLKGPIVCYGLSKYLVQAKMSRLAAFKTPADKVHCNGDMININLMQFYRDKLCGEQ